MNNLEDVVKQLIEDGFTIDEIKKAMYEMRKDISDVTTEELFEDVINRSCEHCVFSKYYPSSGYWCSGVTLLDGRDKTSERLTDIQKAITCEFYDTDSWVK